jgi:hypothetical protein
MDSIRVSEAPDSGSIPDEATLQLVHIRIKQNNMARYLKVPLPQKIRKDQWAGKDDAGK